MKELRSWEQLITLHDWLSNPISITLFYLRVFTDTIGTILQLKRHVTLKKL